MKRKIAIILTAVIILSCFSGCMVKKSGAGATGEATSEITNEPLEEITSNEEIKVLSTKELPDIPLVLVDPTDEYQIEYLDNSFLTSLTPGIIPIKNWEISLVHGANSFLENYKDRSEGEFDSYNIILAKIEDVKEVKIHDRYYIKYKYNIQKVYNGSIKKGETIDVIKQDWSKEQIGAGQEFFGYKDFYKEQIQYPQKGQYVITSIYKENFSNPYLNKDWYNSFYKNEINLIKSNYIDNSSSQSMIVMDNNYKVLAVGETGINISKNKSCQNLKEAEKLINEVLEEIDGEFFSLFKTGLVTIEK